MIFQFGEFFYEGSGPSLLTFLGTIFGPIVSVLIAIWVFRATVRKEKKNENDRLEILKKQIEKYVECLNKYNRIQIEELNKLFESIKEKKVKNYEFIEAHQIDFYLQKISEISQIEFFKIYIQKDNSKLDSLMSLFESIATINRFILFIKKEFNLFIEKYEECQDKYNENIRELGVFASSLVEKSKDASFYLDKNEFNFSVVKIFNEFISVEGKDFRDIYVSYEEFIQKMRNAYNVNGVDNTVINKNIINCEYSYRDLNAFKIDFMSLLTLSIKGLEDSSSKVEENFKNLNK